MMRPLIVLKALWSEIAPEEDAIWMEPEYFELEEAA